jgi:uncharacterized membrane protein
MILKLFILSPIILPLLILAMLLIALCSPLLLIYAMYDRHLKHKEIMHLPKSNKKQLHTFLTPLFDEIKAKKQKTA